MTIANISQASTTAASNVDINNVGIQGSNLISLGDDALRALMAMLAKFYDDFGGVNTVGGTGDAITVTTPTIFTALAAGMRLNFIAGAANTGAATLNLDGIGAKAVRKISGGTDAALAAGDILAGASYDIVYSATANAAAGGWILTATAPRLSFPATITPYANDGAALGTTSLKWSDLHLADGAVINWNNGDVLVTHSTDALFFSGGTFVLNGSAVVTTDHGTPPQATTAFAVARANDTATNFPKVELARSRNTITSPNIVQAADDLGQILWEGYDGSVYARAGAISVEVDTTPGAGDMPGIMKFKTSNDGGVTPLTRMSLNSSGFFSVNGGSFGRGAPVTKTADFTLAATENWVINNRAATNTVTLPAASAFPGREVMLSTIQAQAVVSASSNVVPRAGGAAGTAILPATDGAWATLVSDATNWIIMASS